MNLLDLSNLVIHLFSELLDRDLQPRVALFQLSDLFLKVFALVLSLIKLGQGLIKLALQLTLQRLFFEFGLVYKVGELGLGRVTILSQVLTDLLLFGLELIVLFGQRVNSRFKVGTIMSFVF